MGRKHLKAEEIIGRFAAGGSAAAEGRDLDVVLREIGATKNTFYRWRKEIRRNEDGSGAPPERP